MRQWINLFEQAEWPEQILSDLAGWQDYADYSEVHGDERHGWQQRLIAFMRQNPHQVTTKDGYLYRGTVVHDSVAEALRNGKSAVHKKVGSLLESWSKRIGGAQGYARDDNNASLVLMRKPISQLKIVCDIDQVPFTEESDSFEPNEVLVLTEDHSISPQDVFALCWCDYEKTGNHYSIGPDLGKDVTRDQWVSYLKNLVY
jgi:hypothetical protein